MQEYDKSSKWLIQHHGNSILHLAGVRDILAWRPLQAELVQPRHSGWTARGPIPGAGRVFSCSAEISTYLTPVHSRRYRRDRTAGDEPEVLLVLTRRPEGCDCNEHGGLDPDSSPLEDDRARHPKTCWRPGSWVDPVGAAGKLCRATEPIFRECRERIERDAPSGELENLLAVTQFLASLRYNDPRLFEILGGRQAMIESPVIHELIADCRREDVVRVLVARFGARPRRRVSTSSYPSPGVIIEQVV